MYSVMWKFIFVQSKASIIAYIYIVVDTPTTD